MSETQENKRKIEKTPERSIKTKRKKLMKSPEWSLPEWSMYLFMKRVVRVLIRLYKQFMKSKGHKCWDYLEDWFATSHVEVRVYTFRPVRASERHLAKRGVLGPGTIPSNQTFTGKRATRRITTMILRFGNHSSLWSWYFFRCGPHKYVRSKSIIELHRMEAKKKWFKFWNAPTAVSPVILKAREIRT